MNPLTSLRYCLAFLLGLQLNELPSFNEAGSPVPDPDAEPEEALHRWLATMGYTYLRININKVGSSRLFLFSPTRMIGCAFSTDCSRIQYGVFETLAPEGWGVRPVFLPGPQRSMEPTELLWVIPCPSYDVLANRIRIGPAEVKNVIPFPGI